MSPTGSVPLIQVKNLKKYFRTPKGALHAVDDVSFLIKQGRTLGGGRRIRLREIHSGAHDSPADRGDFRRGDLRRRGPAEI